MNQTEIFRNLVENRFMSDFDYSNSMFSFQTVFNISSYSYCFCMCAFEHEYMMYFQDPEEIDEEIYERVVRSIINGKCPHVDKAPVCNVTNTSVHAIYIAAAVGTVKAVENHLSNYEPRLCQIFKLLPLDIALIKGTFHTAYRYNQFTRCTYHFTEMGMSIPYVKSQECDPNKMVIETVTRFEACLRTRNRESFLLSVPIEIGNWISYADALRATLKRDLVYHSDILSKDSDLIGVFTESAIIYNQPDVLDQILKMSPKLKSARNVFPKNRIPLDRFFPVNPLAGPPMGLEESKLCSLLNRLTCKDVLSNNGLFKGIDMSLEEEILALTSRLLRFYDDCKDDIISALTKIPRNQRETSDNLNHYLTLPHIKNACFQTFINLGANVNHINAFGKTPIDCLLTITPNYAGNMVRQKIALIINENPELELHQRTVLRGIKRDAALLERTIKPYEMPGVYTTDAREHGLFGYDRADEFHLNFMGPFLIECGFPVKRRELSKVLQYDQKLHPAEEAYIRRYLNTPAPLFISCRNVLRNHFKGRRIHSFVEQSECPQTLKDAILIKQLLETDN